MLKEKMIGIIGTGNMGHALIRGLILGGSSTPEHILCSDVREDKLLFMKENYGVVTKEHNRDVALESEIIIYAVKPQLMTRVLKETADALDMSKLVISIAAGVALASIESCLNKELRMIRVMPNIAASVGAGAAAIAVGRNGLEGDLDLARAIFRSVGECVTIEEDLMDAITGLSGSGPAYIFLMVESLVDAAVSIGLPQDVAQELVLQTLLGSCHLIQKSGKSPAELRRMVTSPGGTTAEALLRLEQGEFSRLMGQAVKAAYDKAKQLGS